MSCMDEMDDEYCTPYILHDSWHPWMLQLDHCEHGACKHAGLFQFQYQPSKAIYHEADNLQE